jgi:hypothetical protein
MRPKTIFDVCVVTCRVWGMPIHFAEIAANEIILENPKNDDEFIDVAKSIFLDYKKKNTDWLDFMDAN